jgi:phosphate transport system permease protein
MRKLEERIFKVFMIGATTIVAGSFFLIVFTILKKGLPAMNLDMIAQVPQGGYYSGSGGGVLNAIIGSLLLAGGASLLALGISLPIVLYLNVYLRKTSPLGRLARLSSDVLFGIPSIVYGAFGFMLMIYFGLKASLFAGIITVTLLVIPVMIRTMDEVFRTLPREMMDAAFSLGATKWEVSKVLVLQSASGILTAVLLSFGRAIGDTAAVMFTAGFSDNIPSSLGSPAPSLPLAIFFQLSSPVEAVQARAYAAALILTFIVLSVSIEVRLIGKHLKKNKI